MYEYRSIVSDYSSVVLVTIACGVWWACCVVLQIDGRMWQTYTVNQQTAGYLTKWTNTKMAFLTVHGAGHEVCSCIRGGGEHVLAYGGERTCTCIRGWG